MKKILSPGLAGILFSSVLFSQPTVLYPGQFTIINQVTIYEHSNFTGQSKSFGAGLHRLTGLADMNDLASSIKVPQGFVVVLYEHANEAGGYGNYVDLMEDCADLSTYKFNDKLSFLNVFSASRRGYNYVRNRMVQGQLVPGHWERNKSAGKLPDNTPPAVLHSIAEPAVPEVVQPSNALPAFEEIPVYRIQLKITTGVGTDAGTDNPVFVQFNDNDKKFFLVRGIDNFQEGSTVVYDVLSEQVKKIKDIEFIRFGIRGGDGLCLKKVELFINNSRFIVFSKTWPGTKGICIDNGSSTLFPFVEIRREELRASAGWKYKLTGLLNIDIAKAPFSISKEWITRVVEASVGNQLQYIDGGLKWGSASGIQTLWGEAVEAQTINDNTLLFDLDLERDVYGPNPEVDVDFQLQFQCVNGALFFDVKNIRTSTNLIGSVRDLVTNKSLILITGSLTMATGGLAFPTLIAALNNGFVIPQPGGKMVSSACTKAIIRNSGEIDIR